jgi:hypothetical protein
VAGDSGTPFFSEKDDPPQSARGALWSAVVEAQTKLRPALRCTTQRRTLIGISLTNVTQLKDCFLLVWPRAR